MLNLTTVLSDFFDGIPLEVPLLKLLLKSAVAIGLMAGSAAKVEAQEQAQAKPSDVEEVKPGIVMGTIASPTIVTDRVIASQVVLNGYDMGKLLVGLLNAMGNSPTGTLSRVQLQQILDNARPDKVIKVVLPSAPQPQQPQSNSDKK
jgi:hypothetical protein